MILITIIIITITKIILPIILIISLNSFREEQTYQTKISKKNFLNKVPSLVLDKINKIEEKNNSRKYITDINCIVKDDNKKLSIKLFRLKN